MRHVIASDTDSAYFTLTKLLLKTHPDADNLPREKRIEILLKLTDKIQERANKELSDISQNLFNISDGHHFMLKQEIIAEKAYWAGKRRYALYIVNKEGVDIEELEMKGLDLMKSNFPPIFRNFGEQLIKDILFSVPKSDIDKKILDFKNSLDDVDWKHLMKPTGLKKMDEYVESYPKEGEIFCKFKSRCPINTRAALISNSLLRLYKSDKMYPEFNIGDKMYIVYLKRNPLEIDVVGLNGFDDHPKITQLVENFIDREKIFDSVFKNKIENLYSDLSWDLILNSNISSFFTFD